MRLDVKEYIRQNSLTAMLKGRRHLTKADAPLPLRYDWGGHDPATPMAEMQYNYYWTVWPVVMFVAVQTLTMFMK